MTCLCFIMSLLSLDSLLLLIFYMIIAVSSGLLLLTLFTRYYISYKKRNREDIDKTVMAFFHPYCNAGGGGERVLWSAVNIMQNKYPNIVIYIYTGDKDVTPVQILHKAKNTFNITIDSEKINIVYLNKRILIEHKIYPVMTLLLQSLGSMILAVEAMYKLQPDIYIDTMGYSFTLPIFKYLGGCKTACYVHYPLISTDMLKVVRSRTIAHNNQSVVATNPVLSYVKIWYYKIYSKLYRCTGQSADTIMVNSTWTEEHINSIWQVPFKTHRVYPPCDVSHLKKLQHLDTDNVNILSVGQFRPEKDHPLQLQAMYELRTLLQNDEDVWKQVKLIIVGSCRNEEDEIRVQNMKDLSRHLSLENNVDFRVNVSHQELIQSYQESTIGLHAMWNEHFGISIVECMAAGLIMVANRSGGPLADIIETSSGSQTGFLACSSMEYAQCLRYILYMSDDERKSLQDAARASVDRFSEDEFEKGYLRAMSPIFND